MKNDIISELSQHREMLERLFDMTQEIEVICEAVIRCFQRGNKLLILGNGGSAADAQHIAAELVVRYRVNRKALPAIALTTDTSNLTACGNDFGYEEVFARQVEAIANEGDLVIGISTSGGSVNVLKAMSTAKLQKCEWMAFCGEKRGAICDKADYVFASPSAVTARIQEAHLLVGHIMCGEVEKSLSE